MTSSLLPNWYEPGTVQLNMLLHTQYDSSDKVGLVN